MGFDSVFINGTTGVGKSTALQALGLLLVERGVPHAGVDFDYLRLAWPAPVDDPFHLQLGLRNLSAVASNYRAAGVQHLAVAYVLTNRPDAEAFARAIGGERMLVCRLRAEPDTIEARLRQRHGSEAPWELPWFLERFKALQDELDAAAIDDVVIEVDDLSPTEAAHQVLEVAGW